VSRASIATEVGRVDAVTVTRLADEPERSLLVIKGSLGRLTIEVRTDDLWPIATACRDAVKRHEEEQRMDALAAEVAPVSDMRDFANKLLRGMAGERS